ncbi:MAG: hypothetical protein L0Y72_25590 [Gemmataceae bacterium]|nr:hypothetical protein [Gemmataceae bacterium]MCI0742420.1 hypothetical protein [Gemmataceae bacterium]
MRPILVVVLVFALMCSGCARMERSIVETREQTVEQITRQTHASSRATERWLEDRPILRGAASSAMLCGAALLIGAAVVGVIALYMVGNSEN